MLVYEFELDKALAVRKKEGRHEERRSTALIMLEENEPLEKIVKYSKLPLADILALQKELEPK